MAKTTSYVSLEEAASRTGAAQDGAEMAWLLHTRRHGEEATGHGTYDQSELGVDLADLVGERVRADFSGYRLVARGVL